MSTRQTRNTSSGIHIFALQLTELVAYNKLMHYMSSLVPTFMEGLG